jgi:nucleotide-binding universal stress UspA family protein
VAALRHAKAVAPALGLPITLGRVIETPHFRSPADPIEWKLRRNHHSAHLADLARQDAAEGTVKSVLLSGRPADELASWARENGATVLALARKSSYGSHGLGSTAKHLLDKGTVSLLIVPPSRRNQSAQYRRILVPIDGSARSESVLPVAARIARAHGAELVLAHVVPQQELVDKARMPQLRTLLSQVNAFNERGARGHLEALRARFGGNGLVVRTVIAGPGDARSLLRRAAEEQKADLIVLSSHGRSGRDDVACGSVAEYLAAHAPIPLLLVRPNLKCPFAATPSGTRDKASKVNWDPEAESTRLRV